MPANKAKHDIPVPQIKMVETYEKDVPNNYEITKSFVRYHRPSRDEWQEAIEYVADAEDETWLTNNIKFGGALHPVQEAEKEFDVKKIEASQPPNNNDATEEGVISTAENSKKEEPKPLQQSKLPLDTFEHIMDLFEKATAFDAILSNGQAEQPVHEKIPQITQMFPATKSKAGVVTTKHVINDIYNYWVQKRSKLKRPLLRRFWPVTSTDDTNPHLVFRPREKEKYKLRKTRRNDMLSFNKMKQLRNDFENLRLVLDLVRKREELYRANLHLQCENFEQKLFDLTDTSGKPRLSNNLKKREIEEVLAVPAYFDIHAASGKRGKRGRKTGSRSVSPVPPSGKADVTGTGGPGAGVSAGDGHADDAAPRIIAEQSFAPNFLQPLQTRESYVTSWDNAVPHFTSYINAQALPTFRFRHRPRVGRGGRVCIDRLPCPPHPECTPITFLTAGKGPARRPQDKKDRLLDLLPRPLNHMTLSRRIEELSLAALQEDVEIATGATQGPNVAALDSEENDGDQVLVKLDDWLNTDEQLWGEERYAIGPI